MISHRVEGIVIAPVSDASRSSSSGSPGSGCRSFWIDRTIPRRVPTSCSATAPPVRRSLVEHLIALGHRRIGMIVERTRTFPPPANGAPATSRRSRRAGIQSTRRSLSHRRSDPTGAAWSAWRSCSRSQSGRPGSSRSTTSSPSGRSRPCARRASKRPTTLPSSVSTTSSMRRASIPSSP